MSLRCAAGHEQVGWASTWTRRCWYCNAEGIQTADIIAAAPLTTEHDTCFEGSLIERERPLGTILGDTDAQVTG